MHAITARNLGHPLPRPVPEPLLRDPVDHGPLFPMRGHWASGTGHRRYPIEDAPALLHDLFVPTEHASSSQRGDAPWDPRRFDAHYEDVGYYRDGAEYEARQGLSAALTRFHHRRVKDVLLDWISAGPEHTIMDVGCGAGWFLERVHDRYLAAGERPTVVGLEASRAQARFTAQRLAKVAPETGYAVRGNAERLPFADDTFDLITCSETLEQVEHPIRAVQEMSRVLKPGGRLLISAPSRLGELMWDAVLAPAVKVVKALRRRPSSPSFGEYYCALYPEELESQVRAAGLEVHCLVQNGLIPHNHYFQQLPAAATPPLVRAFDWLDHRFAHVVPQLTAHILLWAEKPHR